MELILLLIIVLLILAIIAIYIFTVRRSKGKQEEKPEKKQPIKKKTQPAKQQPAQTTQKKATQKQQQESYLSSAEYVINLKQYPLCVACSGNHFFVPLRNRQQFLFTNDSITEKKTPVHRFNLYADEMIDCQIFSENILLVVAALDREKSIISFEIDPQTYVNKKGPIFVANAQKSYIKQVRVAPDRTWLATLGDETYIRFFSPNGKSLYANDSHQMKNEELSVSSDSQFAALSSFTSDVLVYGISRDRKDIPTKVSRAFTISNHKNSINSINFHPKENLLISGGEDKKINIFRPPKEDWDRGNDAAKVLTECYFEQPIQIVRFNPVDPEKIAILFKNGEMIIWKNQKTVKTINQVHDSDVTHVEWTGDGKFILVLSTESQFIYAYSG